MSRSRFGYITALACSLILAVPRLAVQAVAAAFNFVASLLPASYEEIALALDLDSRMTRFAGDCPVDAFTSNSLRHEAGMRHLT